MLPVKALPGRHARKCSRRSRRSRRYEHTDVSLCFICVNLRHLRAKLRGWMAIEPCARGWKGGLMDEIVEVFRQAGAVTIAEFIETGADAFHHLR